MNNPSAALAAALFGGLGRDQQEPASKILPEAQVMILREAYARYSAPCPFKAGDLVTPRADGMYKGAGQPHIVLEVLDSPFRPDGNPGSMQEHGRNDMRVCCLHGESTSGFMGESWFFEPYTGEVAEAAKPDGEWTEWAGGDCPVGDEILVDVELADGDKDTLAAGGLNWSRGESINAVLRYRLHTAS